MTIVKSRTKSPKICLQDKKATVLRNEFEKLSLESEQNLKNIIKRLNKDKKNRMVKKKILNDNMEDEII